MHNLIYGGINSGDYKAYITNAGIYKSPAKRYKKHTVPGRNGVLLEDLGTYENIEVEYPFCVYENCDINYDEFIAAMRRKKGYQRIDDTFHPEYYRVGAFLDELEPKEITADAEMCNGVLKFDCLPQKYLTSGENPISFWTPVVSKRTDPLWEQNYEEMNTQKFSFDKVGHLFTITVNCLEDETITLVYQSFANDRETIVDGDSVQLGNNESIDIEFDSSAAYGAFFVQTSETGNISDVSVTFICYIKNEDGQYESHEIEMSEKIIIQNPTGFVTSPLIEFRGLAVADLTIENYNGDELDETYVFYAETDTSIDVAYLDCEEMYMYDGNKNNITNLLYLTTARDSENKSLIFPRLGADRIIITPSLRFYNFEDAPNWLPVVNIYPRWWKV